LLFWCASLSVCLSLAGNYIYSSFTDIFLHVASHEPTRPRPPYPDSILSLSEQCQLAGKLRFALIYDVVWGCRKAHKADGRGPDDPDRDNQDEAIVILCGDRASDDFAASLRTRRRNYGGMTGQTLYFEIRTTETPVTSDGGTQQRFPRTARLVRDKL